MLLTGMIYDDDQIATGIDKVSTKVELLYFNRTLAAKRDSEHCSKEKICFFSFCEMCLNRSSLHILQRRREEKIQI